MNIPNSDDLMLIINLIGQYDNDSYLFGQKIHYVKLMSDGSGTLNLQDEYGNDIHCLSWTSEENALSKIKEFLGKYDE